MRSLVGPAKRMDRLKNRLEPSVQQEIPPSTQKYDATEVVQRGLLDAS